MMMAKVIRRGEPDNDNDKEDGDNLKDIVKNIENWDDYDYENNKTNNNAKENIDIG